MRAPVNKIIPFSCVDGPGNRTAIFLQTCNFDCRYCHNPETIHACVHCGICVEHCAPGALKLLGGKVTYDIAKCVFCDECFRHCTHGASPRIRELTPEQVMEQVRKNMPFIRGITVSGGECTLHRDFLWELLGLAKAAGLNTLLDSNGSYDFSKDGPLMAVTDGVMLDVKAWSPEDHRAVTGRDNGTVLKNLNFLAENGKLTEVRTVIVPELFDCRQTVTEVSKVLARTGSTGSRYKIIRYRPNGVREQYKKLIPPDEALLQQLQQIPREFGITDTILV